MASTMKYFGKILNTICSLYQSNIASRYIVSVGWDNKIKVWMDSTKQMQNPITVMTGANQIEILCIAHYPPDYCVTGGSDGSIAIWNVASGHFQRKEVYPKCASPCCTVSWLSKKLQLIVTGHSNGTLLFWNPIAESQQLGTSKSIVLGFRHTTHKRFGGINCMVTAKKSSIIIT
eukprot:325555_1